MLKLLAQCAKGGVLSQNDLSFNTLTGVIRTVAFTTVESHIFSGTVMLNVSFFLLKLITVCSFTLTAWSVPFPTPTC